MPSPTRDALAGDDTKLTKNAQNTAKPSSSLHPLMQRYAVGRMVALLWSADFLV